MVFFSILLFLPSSPFQVPFLLFPETWFSEVLFPFHFTDFTLSDPLHFPISVLRDSPATVLFWALLRIYMVHNCKSEWMPRSHIYFSMSDEHVLMLWNLSSPHGWQGILSCSLVRQAKKLGFLFNSSLTPYSPYQSSYAMLTGRKCLSSVPSQDTFSRATCHPLPGLTQWLPKWLLVQGLAPHHVTRHFHAATKAGQLSKI